MSDTSSPLIKSFPAGDPMRSAVRKVGGAPIRASGTGSVAVRGAGHGVGAQSRVGEVFGRGGVGPRVNQSGASGVVADMDSRTVVARRWAAVLLVVGAMVG